MLIFPAIDIIDGKVVRLSEGKYDTVKEYNDSPIDVAVNFAEQGATCLHVVDLDGAKSGNADNASTIEQILKECNLFVEVGGGIRSFGQIEKYISCGAGRVILGTVAAKDLNFVKLAVQKYGNRLAVGVDAKDGKVAVNGWTEVTDINSFEFCKTLKDIGVEHVIYTDISKDGKMSGTNMSIYSILCQTEYPYITASGGIRDINEVYKLKELGVYGAIIGKAIYEKAIDLREAIKASQD